MTFKVYYNDGNQKLFEADNMAELMKYLIQFQTSDDIDMIEKIS